MASAVFIAGVGIGTKDPEFPDSPSWMPAFQLLALAVLCFCLHGCRVLGLRGLGFEA